MLTLLCVCNGMAGLLFAVQIGLDYKKQDDRLTLCLFFMFISFFAASAGITGAVILTDTHTSLVIWIWGMQCLLLFLFGSPVFLKYFHTYPGAVIETGLIFSCLIVGWFRPFVLDLTLLNMINMGIVYFGCCEWWRNHRGETLLIKPGT